MIANVGKSVYYASMGKGIHSSPTCCHLLLPFLHPDSCVDDMQLFASLRLDRSEVDFGIKYSIRLLETSNSPESAVRCATVVVPENGWYP